jgi:hypothetical protein
MPRRKCDSDVTDARKAPARTGPRGGTRKRTRSDVQRPDWPRKGDLVECEWAGGATVGVVLEANDNGWTAPEITLLKDDGVIVKWHSPRVRVISRRRRGGRKACK